MSIPNHSLFLAGEPRDAERRGEVLDKYTREPMARHALADDATVSEAIGRAVEARRSMAALPTHARRAILLEVAAALREQREAFARTLVHEVGKPITLSRGEVDRAVDTFTLSAEAAIHAEGVHAALDNSPRGEAYECVWKRVPIGVCSFITPFNFPLNLAAHKVAPAIAAGCPFLLKPDQRTPVTALMLAEILARTDLPPGAFSVLPCEKDARERFATDERINMLSFTGSPEVGWKLKSICGRKRIALELGGNAACIVDETADVAFAAERIAYGAFYQAGQSCISVQRVIAHRDVYDELREALAAGAGALTARDPMDENAILGPLIDESAAERVERWVDEAVRAGATALTGGVRHGVWFEPTLLENTPREQPVSCQEVFGPVATLEPYDDFEEALRLADDSEWGLQAGVMTSRIDRARRAFEKLEVGGVIVNDIPSTRIDSMPYGGVKGSGLGREGPRFAIEDMTEIRLMVTRRDR